MFLEPSDSYDLYSKLQKSIVTFCHRNKEQHKANSDIVSTDGGIVNGLDKDGYSYIPDVAVAAMASRRRPEPPEIPPTLPSRRNHVITSLNEYQEPEDISNNHQMAEQSETQPRKKESGTSNRHQMSAACSHQAVEEQTASSHHHQSAASSGTPSPDEDTKPSTGPVYANVNKTKDDVTMVDNTLYYKWRY